MLLSFGNWLRGCVDKYGLGLGLGLGGWYLPSGSTGGQHVVGSGAIVAQHLGGR